MIENILANLKIERLNPMQEASIDAWKEGKDLILLSPTGSGKTLAYLLPLVQSLKPGITGVQAIVLVPSRELALQIDQVFKSMNTPFKAVSCYGGRPAMEEHRMLGFVIRHFSSPTEKPVIAFILCVALSAPFTSCDRLHTR